MYRYSSRADLADTKRKRWSWKAAPKWMRSNLAKAPHGWASELSLFWLWVQVAKFLEGVVFWLLLIWLSHTEAWTRQVALLLVCPKGSSHWYQYQFGYRFLYGLTIQIYVTRVLGKLSQLMLQHFYSNHTAFDVHTISDNYRSCL